MWTPTLLCLSGVSESELTPIFRISFGPDLSGAGKDSLIQSVSLLMAAFANNKMKHCCYFQWVLGNLSSSCGICPGVWDPSFLVTASRKAGFPCRDGVLHAYTSQVSHSARCACYITSWRSKIPLTVLMGILVSKSWYLGINKLQLLPLESI